MHEPADQRLICNSLLRFALNLLPHRVDLGDFSADFGHVTVPSLRLNYLMQHHLTKRKPVMQLIFHAGM